MISVLIADHDPQSRYLLRRALVGDWKLGIVEVDNGVAALEQIAETKYELLILDQTLPLLDGSEVLEVIRAESRTSSIPVILTGRDTTEAQVRRILALDIRDFIAKPLGVARLSSRLNRVLNQLTENGAEGDTTRRPPKQTGLATAKRALVIDGSAPFRQLLLTLLRKRMAAVGVATGTQAVRSAAEQPPDVIFIGEDTGILRGRFLLNKLRSLPDCRFASVIRLVPPGQAPDAEYESLPQGTLTRASRADVLEAHLVEAFRGRENQSRLADLLLGIRGHVEKAAVEVFEILSGCEVRVSPVRDGVMRPNRTVAMDLPVMGTNTTLRYGVCAGIESLRQLGSWLGAEVHDTADSAAGDLLTESLNLLAGGLRNWLTEGALEVRMAMSDLCTPLATRVVTPLEVSLQRNDQTATLYIDLTRN